MSSLGTSCIPFSGSQVREGVVILRVQPQDCPGAAAYRGPILVGYRLLGFIQEAINLPLEPVAGHATSKAKKDSGAAIVTGGKWESRLGLRAL